MIERYVLLSVFYYNYHKFFFTILLLGKTPLLEGFFKFTVVSPGWRGFSIITLLFKTDTKNVRLSRKVKQCITNTSNFT